MNVEVVECSLAPGGAVGNGARGFVVRRVLADSVADLVLGLQAKVHERGARLVLVTPDQKPLLEADKRVYDSGDKKSNKALAQLFLRQDDRENSERGNVLMQDATSIQDRDGLTKAIRAFLERCQKDGVTGVYFIVVSERLFNSCVQETSDREEIDSRLSQLQADLIGESVSMQQVRKQILQAARHEKLPVYILGETGSGKTAIAWYIHRYSARYQCGEMKCTCRDDLKKHFVDVNCGRIPVELFESEMYGTCRGGQFLSDKPGQFELAHRGTLLLDEMHHMLANHQPKLLTFLGDKRNRRVHDPTVGKILDVRILFAGARDLEEMARAGQYLDELVYRIKVGLIIEMPPLRERGDDVIRIAQACWPQVWSRMADLPDAKGKPLPQAVKNGASELPKDLLEAMASYSWPGNVRRLLGVLNRIATRALDGVMPNVDDFREDVGWKRREVVKSKREDVDRDQAVETVLCDLDGMRQDLNSIGREAEAGNRGVLIAHVRESLERLRAMKKNNAVRKDVSLFRSLHTLEGKLAELELMTDDGSLVEAGRDWAAEVGKGIEETLDLVEQTVNQYQESVLKIAHTKKISLAPTILELREQLAKHAHDIWMSKRAEEGWGYGKERSDALKTNPDMVPYEALSEAEKNYDREMAMGTIQALRALGFDVVRIEDQRG